MSDAVQMPPSIPTVPSPAPVRAVEHVDPAEKTQSQGQDSNGRRRDEGEESRTASSAADRQFLITRDEATQGFVYRSVEEETGEVIWQWPAEQILRRAKFLRELEERALREAAEQP